MEEIIQYIVLKAYVINESDSLFAEIVCEEAVFLNEIFNKFGVHLSECNFETCFREF